MIMSSVSSQSGGNFWANFFVTNRYVSGSFIIIIYILLATVLAYLLSGYIAKIYKGEPTVMDRISGPVVRAFERFLGEDAKKQMEFREYFTSILVFSLFLGAIGFAVIYFQHDLPFSFSNNHMTPSLIFNTVSSFLTNTNLQHYSNPFDLSYFSTTFVITGFMFISAGIGFAASMAFIRGILSENGKIGNFYHDFLVSEFYLLFPLSVVLTFILVLSGIPQTMTPYLTITPVLSHTAFRLPLGPVATLESIKTIGTNGGGFYGANAGFPLGNPDWFTNMVELEALLLIPLASILSLGKVFDNKRFATMLYGVIMIIFVFTSFLSFFGEMSGIPSITALGMSFTGNMLGKETALGISQSTLFSVGSTITSTGAVNSALINYTPVGIMGPLLDLLMNDPLGGVGTGVLNIFMYVIFTVFITSLMVGKLPEIMSLKIGSREIRYSTLSLVTHPLLVIIPFGITLLLPQFMTSFVNTGPDKITQLLYEFATAASNNGSEVGGFVTNQPFFNYVDGIVMLLGRYLLMGFQLLIAQSFSYKKPKVQVARTVDPGSFLFGFTLFFVMILLGLLSFFPILALGPLLAFAKAFNLFILGVIP
jgi:K+-transporting ATPase ATPase A chain